jgi:hypothetical protein
MMKIASGNVAVRREVYWAVEYGVIAEVAV